MDIEGIERATVAGVAPAKVIELGGWLLAMDDGPISRAKTAVPLSHTVTADALNDLGIKAEQPLVAYALVVERWQHDTGLHARVEGMLRQRDRIGNIGLRCAGQQALRVHTGLDHLLHQLLALRDAERVGLAGRAEQCDAVAAFGEQGLGVERESRVIGNAGRLP